MKIYNGVPSLGTTEQENNLYKADELVSSPASFSLALTSPDLWKIYPSRYQDGSSSCVYQARAKMAGILQEQKHGEFVEYSASDYNKRSNYGEGSYPIEALDNMRKEGIGLEALEPSQNKSETELAEVKQNEFEKEVAKVSLLDGYYALPPYNFDVFVSTLHATKKPIMFGFYATFKEWDSNIIDIKTENLKLEDAPVRHEVCATPHYGIYEGKEGFTFEDSKGNSGINKKGVHFMTREFFERRNYIPGLVPTSFKTYEDLNVKPEKPYYDFSKNLQYGDFGADVVALQDMLKYEGYFPANHSSTGKYYELTSKAVLEWQKAHGVDKLENLEDLKGRYFGNKSRLVANKLY